MRYREVGFIPPPVVYSGMDNTITGNIFDPCFTTKPIHKGSGMGLATVIKSMLKKHNNPEQALLPESSRH